MEVIKLEQFFFKTEKIPLSLIGGTYLGIRLSVDLAKL